MSDTNVAQDQIKAYVDRILRMKEEADAIGADIKEIYAEAKTNGFDKTQLGNLVTYLRKKDKDAEKVAEGEAIFDLYLTAYMGASGKVGTKPATHTYASEKPDPIAALRADPSMAIVDPSNIKKNTETQPAPQAGSDLTETSQAPGQVALHPEAKASIDGGATEQGIETPADGVTGDASRASGAAGSAAPVSETDKPAQASASAAPVSKYAAPGLVTWENAPPEGIKRGAVSVAFGNMGQDPVLVKYELENGHAQPIVKIGNEIIDGFCRFMTARGLTQTVLRDGVPVDEPLPYAVVQYEGADPLIDAIRWNVEGRTIDDHQKKLIAANLTRQNPTRKDDIYKAFEIFLEPV